MKTKKVSSSTALIARTKKTGIESLDDKKEKLRLLDMRERLVGGLPHLYGFSYYQWQIDHIESRNKMNFICAANQIGKSVCNFTKMVKWATEPKLWPRLWKKKPSMFWFLMPDRNMILREFTSKWSKEILPRGEMKDHPQYGWRAEFRNKYLWAIHFNSGVTCYFQTYEQDIMALQSSTVDAIFLDEEIPWSMMPELLLRIQSKDGYFNAVMTPTRGQEEWRRVFEERGTTKELFPESFKQQISVLDCKVKADGTPGLSDEYVGKIIARLGTQAEIDLRVFGRFSVSEGLKIDAFSRVANIKPAYPIDKSWHLYSGIDLGGGEGGSLAAIIILAIRPDYQYGRVVETWRGAPDQTTTVLDVFDKYLQMRGNRFFHGEFYDFAAKDFKTLGDRAGFSFQPAEKRHQIGFPLLNALFKNHMLIIDETKDNQDLVQEILTLRWDQNKKTAMDHCIDALRYAATGAPWSMEGVQANPIPVSKPKPDPYARVLQPREIEAEPDSWSVDEDISEWNSEFEGF